MPDDLISERAYLVGDMANLNAGVRSIEFLIARRAITCHLAEGVLDQCAEDLRSLTVRLRCIDARDAALQNV